MSRLAAFMVCASLLAVPSIALAQEAAAPEPALREADGFLDFFLLLSTELTLKDSSGLITPSPTALSSDGGRGTGARVRVPLAKGLFLQGEFQNNSYDGFDGGDPPADVKQVRGGVGFRPWQWPVYGLLEAVQESVEFGVINDKRDATGFGAHVGVEYGGRATAYGQLGFVDLGRLGDGVEYTVGGSFKLNRAFALFVDHRRSVQEDNAGGSFEFADTRLGIRVRFVSGPKKAKAPAAS